jgi:hypothetical protein
MKEQEKDKPLLSRSTIDQAVQVVRRSASNGNTRGFMLAFADERGIGFSFLSKNAGFSSALYALPSGERSVLAPRPEFSRANYTDSSSDSFVETFLKTAARNMRVEYRKLVEHLAARSSEWRFESWLDGEPSRSLDNDLIWRARLWPAALRMAADEDHRFDLIPPDARRVLLAELRAHATEGAIVLYR